MATPKATAWLVGLVVTLFASDVLHGVAAVAENFACTDDAQCGDPTGGNNPHCCYERTAALQQPSNGGKCKASACDGKSNNFKRCSASEACEDSKKCFYQTIESIHGACLDIAEGDEGADKFKIQGCDKPGGCPDATPCCGVGKKCIVNDGAAETKCKCAKPGDCPDNAPCCDTDTCKPIAGIGNPTKCKCTDDANCEGTNAQGNAYCCYEPTSAILQSKQDGGKCKASECDGEIDFRRCVEVPDCKDGNKRHCFSRKDEAASERVYGVCTAKKPVDTTFSDERCRITTDCLAGMPRSCFFRNDTTKPYGKCLSAKDATTGFVNKRDCAKAVDCADPTPCCVPTPKEANSGICKGANDGSPTDVQCGAVTDCGQSPDCEKNRGGLTKCCVSASDLKTDTKGTCSNDCGGEKVERCAAITGCSTQSHKCCVTTADLSTATGGQCKESCASGDSQVCEKNNDCGSKKCYFADGSDVSFGLCLSGKSEPFTVQSCGKPGDCPDDAPCCGNEKKCVAIGGIDDAKKCKCKLSKDCTKGSTKMTCCSDHQKVKDDNSGGQCQANCDGSGSHETCKISTDCSKNTLDSDAESCFLKAEPNQQYGLCLVDADNTNGFTSKRDCGTASDCDDSKPCCTSTPLQMNGAECKDENSGGPQQDCRKTPASCTDDKGCATGGTSSSSSNFCCYKKDESSLQEPNNGGKCETSECDGTSNFRRCTKHAECTDPGKGHCFFAEDEPTYGICIAEKQPDFPDERCAKSTDCLTSSDECCATTAGIDSATGGLCKDKCNDGTETEICDITPSCSDHGAQSNPTSCFYKDAEEPTFGLCLSASAAVPGFTVKRECEGKTGCTNDATPCCVESEGNAEKQSSTCQDKTGVKNPDEVCRAPATGCDTSKDCRKKSGGPPKCCVAAGEFKSSVEGECLQDCSASNKVERPCLANEDCNDGATTNKKCCCNGDGTQLECVANPESCVTRQNCGANPTSAPPAPPPAPTPKSGGSVGNLKVLWLASGTLVLAALAHAVWF